MSSLTNCSFTDVPSIIGDATFAGDGLPSSFSTQQIDAVATKELDKTEEKPNNELNLCARFGVKLTLVIKWVFQDFAMRHLVWIKLIFLFQSASMTILYPFLNLHMKSLGLTIMETAVINAVIPILFIFTPPLAGFLSHQLGNFKILLSMLTGLGGFIALLLLLIPPGRRVEDFSQELRWGLSCGRPSSRARFQKLMLHGFERDECNLNVSKRNNVTFTPGVCGYLCPTRVKIHNKPKFFEYKVIWPNRGGGTGGFGLSEIVDIIKLDSAEARMYHEPDIIDNNIFFPMNWTFHLSCDHVRPNDCIFSPITRAPSSTRYDIQLNLLKQRIDGFSPEFDISSITSPTSHHFVSSPINCGAKEVIAQVISTIESGMEAKDINHDNFSSSPIQTLETRFSGCGLHCLVDIPRWQLCGNNVRQISKNPIITFWCYLLVRTLLGVLTAASLMMFEGAVMSTVQEIGGDYGIQRFVGNFGAIICAPLGGYLLDKTTVKGNPVSFDSLIYVYLGLKLAAALLILFIKLDFKPPAERILTNAAEILQNIQVIAFLLMMMFAGAFWGHIETFLFWFLDDINASKFSMGWTIAVGMVVSLPFLIFSGPITDVLGHINVMVVGMIAYFVRLLGYSFISNPLHVYPFEALEGFTMALMMTSAVTYVAQISTPDTIASIMGIMGALFFGVGKGSGSLCGGVLMTYVGTRETFRYMSGIALTCAIFYSIFQFMTAVGPSVEENYKEPANEKTGGNFNLTPANNTSLNVNNAEVSLPSSKNILPNGPRSLTESTRV